MLLTTFCVRASLFAQWSPLRSTEYRRVETPCDRSTGAQNTATVSRVLPGLPVQTDIRHSRISSAGTLCVWCHSRVCQQMVYVFLTECASRGFVWCMAWHSSSMHPISVWSFAVFSPLSSCWSPICGRIFQSQDTTAQK